MAPKRSSRKSNEKKNQDQENQQAQIEAEAEKQTQPKPTTSSSTNDASTSSSSSFTSPMESISHSFPMTHPIPSPLIDPELIPSEDVVLEQELMLNPDNPRSYLNYIQHITTSNPIPGKTFPLPKPDSSLSSSEALLLGPLNNSKLRLSLKRITLIYERTLNRFPTSYPLWRDYLLLRSDFILGPLKGGNKFRKKKLIQSGRLTLDVGPTLLDGTEKELENDESLQLVYDGGLDGIVGWKEWRSLAAVFERALMWLPKMPRIWLLYFQLFLHPKCPPTLSRTHARRTFDRALRTLPPSLHLRIWKVYLRWAETIGGESCFKIWRRYLKVDPSLTERYVRILLQRPKKISSGDEEEQQDEEDEEEEEEDEDEELSQEFSDRALEASKLLLSLARRSVEGSYVSPDSKSPYNLLIEWLELCEKYPDQIGMSIEEEEEYVSLKNELSKEQKTDEDSNKEGEESSSSRGGSTNGRGRGRGRGRGASNSNRQTSKSKKLPSIESQTDPLDKSKLPIGEIILKDGIEKFPDQAGRLWVGLATYWIKKGELEKSKQIFENGMNSVVTIRDFTQIFDSYAETSEQIIQFLMDELNEEEHEEEEEEGGKSREEKEKELDERMKEFEELMERRPFLINDVLLRRNPDDVQEWEKRVILHGNDDEKIIETYRKAIETINPRKATRNHHQLFLNFAKFYEEGGSAGRRLAAIQSGDVDAEEGEDLSPVEGDLESCRKIFERAVQIPFSRVDSLAEIWCEYSEMEIRHSNYDTALRIMARATSPPTNSNYKLKNISYHDDSLPVQLRLFKSLKLWSFYIDLEESLGTVQSTKNVYDRVLELKIANAQIIINYANFLEENQYFEDSFKAYERGVEAFNYPVAFELWNVYLSKFVKRYGGTKIERARDLFEQSLEKCPAKFVKPIMLMYGKLEEEHGLAKRAMNIYERATREVGDEDRFDMFTFYIAKAAANFGLAATRPIYERAIQVLPDKQTAEMCLRFAALERKLGEIDRARAIFAHGSQFCDPRVNPGFWKDWNSFEIETGSEDTFREMLRIKRSVQAQFNTDISYIAASALSASARNKLGTAQAAAAATSNGAAADPMAQAERNAQENGKSAPAFVAAKTTRKEETQKNDEQLGGDDDDDLM